jgi:hypothetical protein
VGVLLLTAIPLLVAARLIGGERVASPAAPIQPAGE